MLLRCGGNLVMCGGHPLVPVGYRPPPVRTLTLSAGANGSISADTLSGHDGDIVTLSNTPSAGYHLGSYSITGANLTGNKFAFSGSDVTAAASFEQSKYRVIFGENNEYSAGLTATYNGQVVYSRGLGSAQATATGLPYGTVLTMSASSPIYKCFTIGTLSSISASGGLVYDGERNGVGMSASGILTGDGSFRLGNGHAKSFRVQGNFPYPGSGGKTANIYCQPTAFSSWLGTGMSANCKLNIRSAWTANRTSTCGAATLVHPSFRPNGSSTSFLWSGWCDTTGQDYFVTGYLKYLNTQFGSRNSAAYISRTWGITESQDYIAAYRSGSANGSVITAMNGYFWCSGVAR